MADTVQSVDRALDILELLSDFPDGISIKQISDTLNLHKSTVHRLLFTLCQNGYAKQSEEDNLYSPSLKLFRLGVKKIESMDILQIAKPHLQELIELTQEVIHLVVREKNKIVYVDKVEGNQTIRMHSTIGSRNDMHYTSVGKAILSALSKEEVKEIWDCSKKEKLTENTITDYDALIEELSEIKKNGFALDREENELGVTCIASPIFNYKGECNLAISISGPTQRIKPNVKKYSTYIKEYSKKISKDLGYQGKK